MQPEADLLKDLEPTAAANLARHLDLADEWMPHEYVPWDQGRDFVEVPWDPGQSGLSEIGRIAFEVNLLTEDNLPSYHREILAVVGRDGAWGAWVHRWTAEEARHSICIRDYLLVTRGVDPVALERGRMYQMQHGYDSGAKSVLEALAYVSFQELATRISHRNTGRFVEEPVAERLLGRIAADENLHMIFYRNLVGAALQVAPSATVRAIAKEVTGFQMPGTSILDFASKAKQIARAGIYDLRIHREQVVMPLLRHWCFFDLDGLDDDAERAREQVDVYLNALNDLAARQEERRARVAAS